MKTVIFHIIILTAIILMAFISWPCSIIALFLFLFVAIYENFLNPRNNDLAKTNCSYEKVLEFIHQDEMENYRPQILVLTGNPASREALIHFVHNITQEKSLMICGYIMNASISDRVFTKQEKVQKHFKKWMKEKNINAFLVTVANPSFKEGAATLMQTAGVGTLTPNILIMGFKTNWDILGQDNMAIVNEFYATIDLAFAKNTAIGILRNRTKGLDMTDEMRKLKMNEHDLDVENLEPTGKISVSVPMKTRLYKQYGEKGSRYSESIPKDRGTKEGDLEAADDFDDSHNEVTNRFSISMLPAQHELMETVCKFKTPVKNGRIDVWWLNDNGGLAILLPYLLTRKNTYLEGATLRVFTPSSSDHKVSVTQQNMTTILGKFSIDPYNVHIIESCDKAPTSETRKEFEDLIAPFTGSDKNRPTGYTTPEELKFCSDRTMKQLRIAELMRENSGDADLVVVSLPVTRQQEMSPSLYLSWLDIMSRGLPPTLMIRGNMANVGSYLD